MGLHQTKKFMHSKRNNKQSENTTYRMGENIFNGFRMIGSTLHYQKHLVLVVFQFQTFQTFEK